MCQDGILAIEWADRMREPFSDAVTVVIEDKGADCRKIVIEEANSSSISAIVEEQSKKSKEKQHGI